MASFIGVNFVIKMHIFIQNDLIRIDTKYRIKANLILMSLNISSIDFLSEVYEYVR